jgi:hypothetical protein
MFGIVVPALEKEVAKMLGKIQQLVDDYIFSQET